MKYDVKSPRPLGQWVINPLLVNLLLIGGKIYGQQEARDSTTTTAPKTAPSLDSSP